MEQILRYFPGLTQTQQQQYDALSGLYTDWNQKINVISRKDIDFLYEHHVLHSLAIAKVVQFTSGSEILDVGTGGGFPGLPLAIMFPDVRFTLVDSVGKKLTVIDSIAATIGVKNITTIHTRAEDLPGTYDYVVSRAVTRLDEIWAWVHEKIATTQRNALPNGLLYLKGGDIASEIPHATMMQRWELSDMFTEPYFAEKSLVLLSPKRHNDF